MSQPQPVRVDIARPGCFHLFAYCAAEGIELKLNNATWLFVDGWMSKEDLEKVREAGFGVKEYGA